MTTPLALFIFTEFCGPGTTPPTQRVVSFQPPDPLLSYVMVFAAFWASVQVAGSTAAHNITAKIAAEFNVPLWNLWKPMSQLPNNGLRQGDVHPTFNDVSLCNFAGDDLENYGWTVRNLSALKALDRVWRLLNDLPLYGE